jgi:CheY-like chemotaxis protein
VRLTFEHTPSLSDDVTAVKYHSRMAETPSAAHRRQVLVVDDEPQNLATFERVFRNLYDVSIAVSASDALGLLAGRDFDVVVTDFGMPGMNGAALVREAKRMRPVAFVMVTGFMDTDEVIQLRDSGDLFCVLGKPWNRQSVFDAIEGASTHTQTLRARAGKA